MNAKNDSEIGILRLEFRECIGEQGVGFRCIALAAAVTFVIFSLNLKAKYYKMHR